VPVYFAYHNDYLYSLSTVGQKIEWMRANPLVCVEAEEQWVSVVVFGRYEELPDTPEWQGARTLAHTLLQRHAVWWEPAYVRTILHGAPRPLVPVFYRIYGLQITGHRATPEPVPPAN
jgi:nitroimidazol reductase NimA-like FMN-containing flavoprotein (pyridoxamine 5'-phosphate oxidase superfamily)